MQNYKKNVWGVPPSHLRNHQNMLKGCLRLVAGFGIVTNNRKRKIEWCCFTAFSCMLYMPNSSLRTCRKCYTGASNWRSWWKYSCFRKPFWNPFREIVDFAIGVPQNGRSLSHSAESGKNIKKRLRGASISSTKTWENVTWVPPLKCRNRVPCSWQKGSGLLFLLGAPWFSHHIVIICDAGTLKVLGR